MKKFVLTLIILMFGLGAFAGEQEEAVKFFSSFVNASNSYSPTLLEMYSDNARIIRQIVKPNGQLVNAYFSAPDYKKQMRLNAKFAKIRNYKNYYSNIDVDKVPNGYKVSALRRPSTSDYKLKAYTIVQKQSNGSWLIVEEMMQTKEQILLKYAK